MCLVIFVYDMWFLKIQFLIFFADGCLTNHVSQRSSIYYVVKNFTQQIMKLISFVIGDNFDAVHDHLTNGYQSSQEPVSIILGLNKHNESKINS